MDAELRARRALLLIVLALALVIAWVASPRDRAIGSAPVARERFDFIADKARELGRDPARIRAFVENDVAREGYAGVLRGPLGTLWSLAGNDLDRRLLLAALLAHADAREDVPAIDRLAIDEDAYHHLDVIVRTDGAEETATFRTSDLAGASLVLRYVAKGARTVLVLEGPGRTLETTADAAAATTQELVFRHRAPGGATVETRRELFTRRDAGFPSFFHARNRHVCVVTTGFVPEGAFAHARDLSRAREDEATHAIAYGFLAASDAGTHALLRVKKLAARVASPRITIVSTEVAAVEGRDTASISIDLRKDDLVFEGAPRERVAAACARSLLDQALESVAIETVTGRPAFGAADLLTDAFSRRVACVPERVSLVAHSLARLRAEQRAGSALTIAAESSGAAFVRAETVEKGVRLIPSEAVRASLARLAEGERWLLAGPVLASDDDVGRAAVEIDHAVLSAAGSGARGALAFEHVVTRARWIAGATLRARFLDGRVGRETTVAEDATGVTLQIKDRHDPERGEWRTIPLVGSVATSAADRDAARTFGLVFTGRERAAGGRTWGFLSRAVYRELVRDGSSVVRYRKESGEDSEPLRLWLVARATHDLLIDGQPRSVPVLKVTGTWERENVTSLETLRTSFGAVIDRVAGSECYASFAVLDDPDLPFVLSGIGGAVHPVTDAASSVEGRVVDARTGRAIPLAAVAVANGRPVATWPDGRFELPPVEGTMLELAAASRGYVPRKLTCDLGRGALEVALDPAVAEIEWVSTRTARSDELAARPRTRRLVEESLARGCAVGVPAFAVRDPLGGRVGAWLEVDRTGETFARLDDGLRGGTVRTWVKAGVEDLIDWGSEEFNGVLFQELFGTELPGFGGAAKAPRAAIAYLSGRTAAWYLFAAGVLDSISVTFDAPGTTLAEMLRHASRKAREYSMVYRGDRMKTVLGATFGMSPVKPLDSMALQSEFFLLGLDQGLDWCEELYRTGWGL